VLIKYKVNLGQFQGSTLNKGLVGYWSMDEDEYVEGTENILNNPTGQSVSNSSPGSYQPGWDINLHSDAIQVYNWASGYNGGVTSASTGYHAKWVYEGIEGDNDPCIKFIDRNDLYGLGHRWLGISQSLGTPSSKGWSVGDEITISWWQKTDVSNKGARPGLYHHLKSTGSYAFESNIATINSTKINQWEQLHFTTTIGSDWDLEQNMILYVYGHSGSYGTLWVDNVQVAKKDHVTPFTDGIRYGRLTEKTPYSNHGDSGIEQSFSFSEDRAGNAGGAMNFNGDQPSSANETNPQYVQIPASERLRPKTQWTVSAWINPSTLPQTSNGAGIFDYGSNNMISVQAYSSGVRVNIGAVWTVLYAPFSAVGAEAGEFIHVTTVYDNSTATGDARLYYNGQLVDSSSGLAESVSHTNSAWIGRRKDHLRHSFKGDIDDVKLYNRALSESEIQSLYDSYKPKISAGSLNKGLILDMPLTLKYTKNETSGSEIMTDKTPYSNDGQNYGATISEEGADFDGVDDYLKISHEASLNTQEEITISSWFLTRTNSSGHMNIIGKQYSTAWELNIVNNDLYFNVNIGGNYYSYFLRKDDIVTENTWNHALFTYNSNDGVAKLYFNNVLVDSRNITGLLGINNQDIEIGHRGSSLFWNGKISNVRIYNRALSETEIKSLYDKGRDTSSGMTIKPYGSVSGMAGLSCLDILNNNPSAINNDGVYWIDPDGTGAFQVYCDMTSDGGGWSLVYHGLCNSATDVTYTTGEEVQISSNIKFNQMRIDAVNWPYSITRTTTEEAIMKETFSGYYQWLHEQPSDPAPTISFHSASTGVQDVKFTSNGIMFGYGNSWRKIANPFYTQHHPSYMYLGAYSGYGINGATDWGYGNYNQHMLDTSPTESGLGLTPIESQEIKTWIR
jgi:hypothetical protein